MTATLDEKPLTDAHAFRLADYHRFKAQGGVIVGQSALWALRDAKTLAQWRESESAGLVKIEAHAEEENYFDVYGEPEGYTNAQGHEVSAEQERNEICEQLDRNGCWYVVTYAWQDGEWQLADSIGMCSGYNDPCSPFENCYVPGLMRSALEMIPQDGEH